MQTDLIRIEPEQGRFRFYRLALWPDLFGGVSLVREWGRIGSPGKLRIDPHACLEDATAALERLARAKRRRGYREAGQRGA